MQALEELDYLAALDDDGNLSEIGIIMSEIPLDPQLAKALLASCEFDCVSEMLTIAAMLSGAWTFLRLHWGAFINLRHLFDDNVLFRSVRQRQVATWTRRMRLPSVTGSSSTLKAITSPSSTSTTLSNKAKQNNVTDDSQASFQFNVFIVLSSIDVI